MIALSPPNPMKLFAIVLTVVGCWVVPAVDAQEGWTRFRGPNGSGLAPGQELPTTWQESDYHWTAPLKGSGSSSPVLWNNRLFITSANPQTAEFHVQCFDADSGKLKWTKSFPSQAYRVHNMNSFASSTPAVDADRVYVTYANPDHTYLIALDHDGNEQWQRDFGRWVSAHGFSISPLVYKDSVILCNSQQATGLRTGVQPGQSELIAVRCETGKDLWRTPLKGTRANYSLPAVLRRQGHPDELVGCTQAEGFFGFDPATGKINWSEKVFRMRTVASTLIANELFFGSNGSGGGGNYLVAATRNSKGFEKKYEVNRSANYVSTPIAVNGLLFLFGDKGVGSCLDLESGTEHWRKRLASSFSGSPVSNGKHIYVMEPEGEVIVLEAAAEFKVAGRVKLGETTRATPAIANGHIYFRTDTRLFALPGGK